MNATLCQNFKAIGEELSEITCYVQTNIYIFIYIDLCIYAVLWPLEKELRKRLVKCFVWSVALYGAETWTLRRNEQKRLEAFEMWIWRRMERVEWTDKIKNCCCARKVGERRIMLELMKRKRNWMGRWLRRNYLLMDALEGIVNGKTVRGWRRYQMVDNIMINWLYEDTKRKAERRVELRMLGLQWKTCPWAEQYDRLIDYESFDCDLT